MVAMANIHVYLKYSKNCITNNGDINNKKFIFPILLLLLLLVVVVVVIYCMYFTVPKQ